MSDVTLTTGDYIELPITLRKGGLTFTIPSTATIKAAIVSYDRKTVYSSVVTVVEATAGSDWVNSLIVAVFQPADTNRILHQGSALVEVQVTTSSKPETWFLEVGVVRGNVT